MCVFQVWDIPNTQCLFCKRPSAFPATPCGFLLILLVPGCFALLFVGLLKLTRASRVFSGTFKELTSELHLLQGRFRTVCSHEAVHCTPHSPRPPQTNQQAVVAVASRHLNQSPLSSWGTPSPFGRTNHLRRRAPDRIWSLFGARPQLLAADPALLRDAQGRASGSTFGPLPLPPQKKGEISKNGNKETPKDITILSQIKALRYVCMSCHAFPLSNCLGVVEAQMVDVQYS